MRVAEMFASIEGEGPAQGLPALFIRFAGCSLRCDWCDTRYAQDRKDGEEMTSEEVLRFIRNSRMERVVLTGGEPLEQITPSFVDEILEMGRTVEIETNGAHDVGMYLMDGVEVIMDWKLPSSGMMGCMKADNLRMLRPCDTVNMVVASDEDLRKAEELPETWARVQVTACAGRMDLRKLAEAVMRQKGRWRMSYQLHKVIWPDVAKGV